MTRPSAGPCGAETGRRLSARCCLRQLVGTQRANRRFIRTPRPGGRCSQSTSLPPTYSPAARWQRFGHIGLDSVRRKEMLSHLDQPAPVALFHYASILAQDEHPRSPRPKNIACACGPSQCTDLDRPLLFTRVPGGLGQGTGRHGQNANSVTVQRGQPGGPARHDPIRVDAIGIKDQQKATTSITKFGDRAIGEQDGNCRQVVAGLDESSVGIQARQPQRRPPASHDSPPCSCSSLLCRIPASRTEKRMLLRHYLEQGMTKAAIAPACGGAGCALARVATAR